MGRLSGRILTITGASSGIGAAIATRAAREGAAVVLGARRIDRLAALVRDIEQSGGRALAVACDVVDRADVDRLVAATIDAYGRIDVMVANAGIAYYGPFDTTPHEALERLVAVNVIGTFHAAQAALVAMKRTGAGHIIAISSIVGRRGIGGSAAYAATKAAQVAFIEALRAECRGTGIHASVVLPVSTRTELRETARQTFGHRSAGIGPVQSAEHVADAVIRCVASPRAEVYPHRASRLLAVANIVSPALTDRIVHLFRRRQLPDAPGPHEPGT